jgi:hypothetical protein
MRVKPQAVQIDFADPADIRQKLPRLREFVAAKRREVEHWQRILDELVAVAGEPNSTSEIPPREATRASRQRKRAPVRDTAVEIINSSERPMRVERVREALEAKGIATPSLNAVASALWTAEQDGRIRKVGPREYTKITITDPPLSPGESVNGSGNGPEALHPAGIRPEEAGS